MTIFDIASEIDNYSVQIERARAVLKEAMHYFEEVEHQQFLPTYADHIALLLDVTNSLLHKIPAKLDKAAKELYSSLKRSSAQAQAHNAL